ncbi:M23 family metallopeptidase [Helicobacter sp. 23-1045]
MVVLAWWRHLCVILQRRSESKMKNIREKFIISIIDNDGVRQFNVHRFITKVLAYFVGFFVIASVVLFFTIRFLADELKSMQGHKDDTLDKYAEVYKENLALKGEIKKSKEHLEEINQKIVDLEDVISMKNAIIEAKETNPFDISTLTLAQKKMILQIIPHSTPFKSKNAESSVDSEAKNPKDSAKKSTDSANQKDSTKAQFQRIGVLFEVPKSTPIIAAADGIVDLTRGNDTKGIGKFVKIVHTFGFNSIYGHLSKVSVKRGDVVKKGQIIGYSGTHNNKNMLYYDIRFLGSKVNMEAFLKWDIGNFDDMMNAPSIVNWDSLLWTFNDMVQISSHKVLSDSAPKMKN